MWSRRLVLLALALGAGACGSEIGDSCSLSQDCSPDGDRICDNFQPQGYCTVLGCDFDTCPGSSVCIRFFTGSFTNRPCNHTTEDVGTDMCSVDELCALDDHCVPRSAEVRYCMKTCDQLSDCRTEYECRDVDLMKDHGGEPVLAPGQTIETTPNPPKFCAAAPNTAL